MILTTIAIIWLTAATVFVLALGMAAAKPVPQRDGLAHDFAGFSAPEDLAGVEDAPQSRLYCGRSMNLLNDRISAGDFQQNQSPAGQRGGMTGLPKANDAERAVSF